MGIEYIFEKMNIEGIQANFLMIWRMALVTSVGKAEWSMKAVILVEDNTEKENAFLTIRLTLLIAKLYALREIEWAQYCNLSVHRT